ncbi:MAG: hypothetical protein QNJ17_15640 [Desulfocapsaceae bacterium]|nr:hypothetical protein [Desulfocapsaceae bacterium]
MNDHDNKKPSPPEIGPYVFPVILAALGLWCFYDGWLTTNPEMQEHKLFNQIASAVLLSWAVIDVIRTKRAEKKSKN